MKTSRAPDVILIAATVVIGVAAALGAFAALSTLATPHDLDSRIDTIEASVAQAKAVFDAPRPPSHYLIDPVCHAGPSFAGDLVRAEVAKAARQAGLPAPTVTLASSDEDLTSRSYPVMFTIDVTDRYDLVLGFLNQLAQSEPEVFADSLDLTSKTSAVALRLTGRVECSTSP